MYLLMLPLLGGRPVILAGELSMRAGKIYQINSESGHYKPVALDMYFGIKAIKNKMPNAFKRGASISYWDDTGRKMISIELFVKKMETIQKSGKPLWQEQLEEKEAKKQQYFDMIKSKSYSAEKPKQVNLSEHKLTQHMQQSQKNDINRELGILDSDDEGKNEFLKNKEFLENNLNNLRSKKLSAKNKFSATLKTINDMHERKTNMAKQDNISENREDNTKEQLDEQFNKLTNVFTKNHQAVELKDKITQAEQNLEKQIEAMKLMENKLEADQKQDKIRLKNTTLEQVQMAVRKRIEERDIALKKFFELKDNLDKLKLMQPKQDRGKSKDNYKRYR